MKSFQDSAERPYLHLVDGGVSDNLGMRAVLEGLEALEASSGVQRTLRSTSRLLTLRRIVVFVVNSLSVPKVNWDKNERPPNDLQILLKATGVPIDHYSYEAVEQLKDTAARWANMRVIRNSAAMAANKDPAVAVAVRGPNAEIYAVDVSFARLKDTAERAYLNLQPTSFVLPDEAVDRLRAAAGTIIQSSPDFQRLLKTIGARVVDPPAGAASAPASR
jgi:NTE family protein